MIRVITTIFLFIFGLANAQSQYESGMKKAFGLWGEGKSTEASALFERIAAAEKTNWLPSYYVALVNTTDAFQTQDKEKISALLTRAQAAIDNAELISPDNSEIFVVQALIQTAWIVYDPMTNGMKLSGKVKDLYAKAITLNPNNPRALFGKAEFDMGGAKYFGGDTTAMCADVERSIALFDAFKPETEFHPNWGKDRAVETLKECQSKK
jgi:hypothetical protein